MGKVLTRVTTTARQRQEGLQGSEAGAGKAGSPILKKC